MKWTKEAIEAPHTQREIEQASEDLMRRTMTYMSAILNIEEACDEEEEPRMYNIGGTRCYE